MSAPRTIHLRAGGRNHFSAPANVQFPVGPNKHGDQRCKHGRSRNHVDKGRRSPGARDLFPAADRRSLRGRGGRVREAQRHLAGRSHPRQFPREAHPRATDQRRTHRTRRARDAARSQHHEAAEHLRLDPAAQSRDQGTARQGLRRSGLSGQPDDGSRKGHQVALCQGVRQRRQPGIARRQFRPPRRRRRQAIRPQPSAQDGRLEFRFQIARGVDVGRRFLRLGSLDHRPVGDQRPHRAGRRQRRRHGAQSKDAACGRRDHRRSGAEPQSAARLLCGTDRSRQEGRRAVFTARQGHHDEDLRSHRVRSCRFRHSSPM